MNHIAIERDGAVATFWLNRPPANAIDLNFAAELEAAFAPLSSAADVGAIVMTGTGSCFCAGLDLKLVPQYSVEQQRAMVSIVNRTIARLYACTVPVVGAINGHAIAGGLILALACDYRVGTTGACKLGLTEARAGIPFPAAAMTVLQAEVAPNVARVMTLQAENMGADAALSRGLLDELQPPARVLSRAIEVAQDLASIPRDAYARIKHQLRARPMAAIDETLARATDPSLESWLTSEASGASAALLRRSHSTGG